MHDLKTDYRFFFYWMVIDYLATSAEHNVLPGDHVITNYGFMARNISWEPASTNIQTAASMVAVGKLKQGFGLLNHTQVS
jgi:hypothetical protein